MDQALSGGGQRATVALMEMPVTVAMRLQKGIDRVYPSKPDLLRSKRDLLPTAIVFFIVYIRDIPGQLNFRRSGRWLELQAPANSIQQNSTKFETNMTKKRLQ